MICSKAKLYFALAGDDVIRDQIPLAEILSVDVMRESKDLDNLYSNLRDPNQFGRTSSRDFPRRRSSTNESDDTFMTLNIFQIRTMQDGFNSGRTYYLKAESKDDCDKISSELKSKAVVARRRAEGTSRFLKSQSMVAEVYLSTPFQLCSALLILAVI